MRKNSASSKKNPPVRRKPRFAPVTLSEQDGVRYLHFGTEWIQGAMRIRKPDWIELEYAQQMMAWMLFIDQPSRIVQLGLGAAALTKFCRRWYPKSPITVVELNPSVIDICHSMFKLPPSDDLLDIIEADAGAFVEDRVNHGTADVLQIDLYDATARGPVLDTPEFYRACARCLTRDGVASINLFGDHPSYQRNLRAICSAFDAVISLPEVHQGNIVVIAFRQAPPLDFTDLYARAAVIRDITRLPAKSWVDGIKSAVSASSPEDR
jgi:spermidine synthase